MIKLTKILFALSLVLVMNACGGDDESTAVNESLVGTWKAESLDASSLATVNTLGVETTSGTTIQGANLDYQVVFTEAAFTTSGSYDLELSTEASGIPVSTDTQSYTNVTGSGTYTSSGSTISISGSFFDFDVDGVDLNGLSGAQDVTYEINPDGDLIITQDEETEVTILGVTTKSTVTNRSVWKRQ